MDSGLILGFVQSFHNVDISSTNYNNYRYVHHGRNYITY